MFGNNFNNMLDREVIKKTKNNTLLHIASTKRVNEVFTLNGECGVCFVQYDNNNRCIWTTTCDGKVHLLHNGKTNLIRYIVDETPNRWKVQLDIKINNSNYILISILTYSVDLDPYEYKKQSKSSVFIVKHYSPIRFLVNKNGKCVFVLGID